MEDLKEMTKEQRQQHILVHHCNSLNALSYASHKKLRDFFISTEMLIEQLYELAFPEDQDRLSEEGKI